MAENAASPISLAGWVRVANLSLSWDGTRLPSDSLPGATRAQALLLTLFRGDNSFIPMRTLIRRPVMISPGRV